MIAARTDPDERRTLPGVDQFAADPQVEGAGGLGAGMDAQRMRRAVVVDRREQNPVGVPADEADGPVGPAVRAGGRDPVRGVVVGGQW